MHPFADYILSILFVTAAIAIPTEVNILVEEEKEQTIEVALIESESNEITLAEILTDENLIESKRPITPVAEIVASSY